MVLNHVTKGYMSDKYCSSLKLLSCSCVQLTLFSRSNNKIAIVTCTGRQ